MSVAGPLPFDDDRTPLYSVGQVASFLRVQQAFLRRIDAEAVLSPARSAGGQRRYSRVDVDTARRVATMADQGMTLVGIRRIFELEAENAALREEIEALKLGLAERDAAGPVGRKGAP